MKCPHCGEKVPAPFGWIVHVYASGPTGKPELDVVILTCTHCDAILGAVNLPQS